MKYRKKPVVIEAYQVPPEGEHCSDEMFRWMHASQMETGVNFDNGGDGSIYIYTSESAMRANPGDWIIKGVKGELYPCNPDIFAQTYDPA